MHLLPRYFFSRLMQLVVQALDAVPEKYYSQPRAKLIDGKLTVTEGQSNNESTFSHKLVAAIEDYFIKDLFHNDKQFETEIPKQMIFKNVESIETYGPTFNALFNRELVANEEFYTRPDIVVHAGSNDFETYNQIFIGELKTTQNLTQNLFDIDFFKTNIYHQELKFSYSAFIIVNVSENEVRTRFREYCAGGFYMSGRKRLYIIVKSRHDLPAKVYRIN